MAGYVGYMARGIGGALAAHAGFGMPSFLMMVVLSVLYVHLQGVHQVVALFKGLQVIVIAIVVVGVYFFAPSLLGQPTTPATPAPTAMPTQAATPIPTPTSVLTSTPTLKETIVEPTQVQNTIPRTGVWVHVQYEGNFEGRVGAPGRFKEVSSSGNQLFQIPAKDEIVTASITKMDNSGNPLTIEFYNEGVLINTATITKPKGTLDLDADLRTTAPSVIP